MCLINISPRNSFKMAKNHISYHRGEFYYTPNEKFDIKNEPVTPVEEDFCDFRLDCSQDEYKGMRKSLSMNDIAALQEDLVSLGINDDKDDIYERYRRPTGATHELSKTKYVSMAEAIYHYQRDTPGRFHSTKPQNFRSQGGAGPSGLTVPQSPMLRCKARSRPLHILSQREKEELEIEEIKKYKIKANPIPKSVIEGTINLPEVAKKPTTVPEPFNLTEIQKKPIQSPDHYYFKARPAPKHILEKPQVPIKPLAQQVTKPVSPNFIYKRSQSNDKLHILERPVTAPIKTHKSAEKSKMKARQGPVRPEPFSFEKRDEELKRRREARIKQQIEEERKLANLFKAQPLPGAVKKQMRSVTIKGTSSTTSSDNKENHIKFEARPASVLYKEPFKPVLQQTQVLRQVPFALTTEKRAAERDRFDRLLKEKEEEQNKLKKLHEEEKQMVEARLNAQLRAKLVHHPKSIPVTITNPFIPEKSAMPVTIPQTPKFIRRQNQN